MFEFCHEHLKGIAFTYIKDEEIIQHHNNKLLDRFENSVAITGTRSFHCFVPVSKSSLGCFITSQANEIYSTTKAVQITLHTRDSIACVCDGQWWLAEVNDSDINKDVFVTFYRSKRQLLRKRPDLGAYEQCFKETNCFRTTTTTGRTHNIFPKLSEEISKLLNEYKSR
ncbi:hypothetical protein AVEN_176384-1 [Araneus ventricosus]|uniref:Uncharacterized protein n=1 Tax=Araneus ventricosus TaxID=182803 RepID=A0A4Y2C904_ARAVE|nr:hypothetical protein AVEN_176384-1 [Araneus ventricosus]